MRIHDFLSFLKKIDWKLNAAVLAILVLSIFTFYGINSKSGDFVQKQILFSILGLLIILLLSSFNYKIFKDFSSAALIVYFVSIVLLILALASREIRGISAWIVFGGFTFEPSEFAKLATLILLAKYFSQKHAEIYRIPHILASGIYVAIPVGLTLIQPDLGSTTVFVILWIAILLFSGIKKRHLLTIFAIGLIVVSLSWFVALKPYQKTRIISFIDPYLDPRGSGYNTLQARTAIGSGQIFGNFWKNENERLPVSVPEPYNDFAFSAFAQKFGFAGVATLFGLLVFIFLRVGLIGQRADNNFAKLFSLGFLVIIFTHVLINAGMNLGILPITGIPFSFLSYGGSHLLTLALGLGIIQSIKVRNRS